MFGRFGLIRPGRGRAQSGELGAGAGGVGWGWDRRGFQPLRAARLGRRHNLEPHAQFVGGQHRSPHPNHTGSGIGHG